MTTELEVVAEPTQVASLAPLNASLAIEQQREAGLNALARITDAEFIERMKSLRLGLDRFDMMMREVLEPGVDLMTIEGVPKPILTLSGAEKICFVARLVPSFIVERSIGSPPESPAIHYVIRCNLHLGNDGGPVVAQGVGSANSHEKKYRWRNAEKKCPACSVIGAVVKSKFDAKPGTEFAGTKPWFCWKKKGGCGAEFAEDDTRITGQTLGMVENADPYDLDNTLLKMGKKRALVDAAKTATASSGRVTQDLDENVGTSDAAVRLRADVAKKLGWSKLGDIFTVVSKATGKPVKTKVEYEKLTANDLAKVLAAMPFPNEAAPVDESAADIDSGPTSDGEDLP
jgi:hypothetical protein